MKLKDFFIKQKVPQEERDRILLVGTPDEIVWGAGAGFLPIDCPPFFRASLFFGDKEFAGTGSRG